MTAKRKPPYRPAIGDHVMWGKYYDGLVEQVIEVPGKRHAIALVRKYIRTTGKPKRLSPGLTTLSTGSLHPYEKRAYLGH